MILNKFYKVLITTRNISKFKDKYDVKLNEYSNIFVHDLSKGSHLKIDVKCDICGEIFNRPYKQELRYLIKHNYDSCNKCKYKKVKETNLKRYGVENTFQSDLIKSKIIDTNLIKYGVDNPAKSEIIKSKMKETNLKKYGCEYVLSNKDIRKKISITKIKKGIQSSHISKYDTYKNRVKNLTKLIKEKLLKNWDGFDYYDNEYIRDNFNLDHNNRNYPTIDHKISVLYGFLNGISKEDISDISNLCITKRWINSSKTFYIEEQFKEKFFI